MTDPFDELETRLRAGVRRHAGVEAVAPPAATPARRRRWRGRRALLGVAVLAASGGVAVAALRPDGVRKQGVELANEAYQATVRSPSCDFSRQLSSAAPEVVDVPIAQPLLSRLPLLATDVDRVPEPTSPGLMAAAAGPRSVIRGSARRIEFGSHLAVRLYVALGGIGMLTPRRPQACVAARVSAARRIAQRHHLSDDVRAVAIRVLQRDPDVSRDGQTAFISYIQTPCPEGRGCAGGGTAISSVPRGIKGTSGRPPSPGLLLYGGRVFLGIAPHGAARAELRVRYPHRVHDDPWLSQVRQGIWLVRVPKHVGPAEIGLTDGTGRHLQTVDLRRGACADKCRRIGPGDVSP